jgi:hypothetical protein
MNFLVESFNHAMDAIKTNGTMKTKLWKSLRNFGCRYETLEVIQHGGALRSDRVSARLGNSGFGSVISRQQCGTSGSGFLPVIVISICFSAFFFSFECLFYFSSL